LLSKRLSNKFGPLHELQCYRVTGINCDRTAIVFQVILVKWNEPYQKLASCDSSGIIFVWIKYEGRWSIELINDRNTPVTHFSWSHDGRMALICYQVRTVKLYIQSNNTINAQSDIIYNTFFQPISYFQNFRTKLTF